MTDPRDDDDTLPADDPESPPTSEQSPGEPAAETRPEPAADEPKAEAAVQPDDSAAPEASPRKVPAGERIAKVMSRAGVASRREAERMIVEGRVTVNGRVIDTPALDVTPADRIMVDGKPMEAPQETRLWLYYKPVGIVTTDSDEKGRQTIQDALPRDLPRVMTVGRLDLNSEGLLLLTNDGTLKRQLELPSTGWLRRYRVRVNGTPNDLTLAPLKRGITIEGEEFAPMEVTIDSSRGANSWLTVGIREGRNREIRRAMAHIGLTVNRLIRIGYGPFKLADMEKNEVREVKRRVLREQLGGLLPDAAAEERTEAAEAPRKPRAPRRGDEGGPARPQRAPGGATRRPGVAEGARTAPRGDGPRPRAAEGEGARPRPRRDAAGAAPRRDGPGGPSGKSGSGPSGARTPFRRDEAPSGSDARPGRPARKPWSVEKREGGHSGKGSQQAGRPREDGTADRPGRPPRFAGAPGDRPARKPWSADRDGGASGAKGPYQKRAPRPAGTEGKARPPKADAAEGGRAGRAPREHAGPGGQSARPESRPRSFDKARPAQGAGGKGPGKYAGPSKYPGGGTGGRGKPPSSGRGGPGGAPRGPAGKPPSRSR